MLVVGPSMAGKSYFVKALLERDRIEYEDHMKRPKYTGSMDSIKICFRI